MKPRKALLMTRREVWVVREDVSLSETPGPGRASDSFFGLTRVARFKTTISSLSMRQTSFMFVISTSCL